MPGQDGCPVAQSAVGSLRALGELTVEVHDAHLVLAVVANEAGDGHELCAHHATGYGSACCLGGCESADEEGSVSGVGGCEDQCVNGPDAAVDEAT